METFILIHYKKDDATLINDAVTYISCFQSRLFILMAYLKFENFTFYWSFVKRNFIDTILDAETGSE